MGLLSTLSNLLRALAAYWELKAKRYEHDVREQSRSRIEALEDELEKLRNTGGLADSLSADRVRDRILTEKAYSKYLPNAGTQD